jgi:uncharacterized membrane-anchored protein YjiN (DUF445 family)
MIDIKKKNLTKMRLKAGLLLLSFIIIYILGKTYLIHVPHLGIILAFSEAAMVGGMADWFAVTALFRRPFGIPIPHTALIPRKKDEIGLSLGNYVQENFLTPDSIVSKLKEHNVSESISKWLTDKEKVKKATAEVIKYVPDILNKLSDEDINKFIRNNISEYLNDLDLSNSIAQILKVLISNNKHQEIFDQAIIQITGLLQKNESKLRSKFGEKSPWYIPGVLDDVIFNKILCGIMEYLTEINDNRKHEVRKSFDQYIYELIIKLETSNEYKDKVNNVKDKIIHNDVLNNYIGNIWSDLKKIIIEDIKKPNSNIQFQIEKTIERVGENFLNDKAAQEKLNSFIEIAALGFITKNSDKIVSLIAEKVKKWDAKDFSDTLELQVGSDLQYIRISGTLVGGLIGIIIYLFTHFI